MRTVGFSGKFWTLIILVFIVFLVSVGVFFLVTYANVDIQPNNGLNPENVAADIDNYVGKNITVKGYFFTFDPEDEFAYVTSNPIEEPLQQGEFEEEEFLLINYSLVNYVIESNIQYFFHGTVEKTTVSDIPLEFIYLNVYKIERV